MLWENSEQLYVNIGSQTDVLQGKWIIKNDI